MSCSSHKPFCAGNAFSRRGGGGGVNGCLIREWADHDDVEQSAIYRPLHIICGLTRSAEAADKTCRIGFNAERANLQELPRWQLALIGA